MIDLTTARGWRGPVRQVLSFRQRRAIGGLWVEESPWGNIQN